MFIAEIEITKIETRSQLSDIYCPHTFSSGGNIQKHPYPYRHSVYLFVNKIGSYSINQSVICFPHLFIFLNNNRTTSLF